MLQGKELWTVA